MEPTPFYHLERRVFLKRMLLPAVGVLFIGFITMGSLSKTPGVDLPPMEMARYQSSHFISGLFHPSPFCGTGQTVNNYQQERCDEYRAELLVYGFWTAVPWLGALLFLFLAHLWVQHVYSTARRSLESGRGSFEGVVTKPAELPDDVFAWFHCCRVFSIQISQKAGKKQVAVYLPMGAPIPKPGGQLAAASVGNQFGKERFIGAIYTPHIAIISHQDQRQKT